MIEHFRYSAKDLPEPITCGHNGKTYRCTTLKINDLHYFHKAFYRQPDTQKQDAISFKNCSINKVKNLEFYKNLIRRHNNSEIRDVLLDNLCEQQEEMPSFCV